MNCAGRKLAPRGRGVPLERSPSRHRLQVNNVVVCVKQGDITLEEGDVVVTGEDEELSGNGGTSRALMQAGGKKYRKKRKNLRKRMEAGVLENSRVLTTRGGALPYTEVYHVLVPGYGENTTESQWYVGMTRLSEEIILEAEENRVKVLVMPLLGSGKASGPPEVAVRALLDAIRDFRSPVEHLRYVLLVDKDPRHVNLVCEEFSRRRRHSPVYDSPPAARASRFGNSSSHPEEFHFRPGGTTTTGAAAWNGSGHGKQGTDLWENHRLEDVARGDNNTATKGDNSTHRTRAVPATDGAAWNGSGRGDRSADRRLRPSPVSQARGGNTAAVRGENSSEGAHIVADVRDRDAVSSSQTAHDRMARNGSEETGTKGGNSNSFPRSRKHRGNAMDEESHRPACVGRDNRFPGPGQSGGGREGRHAAPESGARDAVCDSRRPLQQSADTRGQQSAGARDEPPSLQGRMFHSVKVSSLPGHQDCGTIVIEYSFPNGTQKGEDPRPGMPYKGIFKRAYLPDNAQGRELLQRLRRAFDRGMLFKVKAGEHEGQEDHVTWRGIPHKTNISGGYAREGYPDVEYLDRLDRELERHGLPRASMREGENWGPVGAKLGAEC